MMALTPFGSVPARVITSPFVAPRSVHYVHGLGWVRGTAVTDVELVATVNRALEVDAAHGEALVENALRELAR